MPEFKTSNGVKAVINAAPFSDAMALKNAMFSQIKLSKINVDAMKIAGFSAIKEIDVAPLIETLVSIDSDPKVNEALMKCLNRCTYNSVKITEATFEDEKAREDYYEIVFQCIKVNISPFLKGLISRLSQLPGVSKDGNLVSA